MISYSSDRDVIVKCLVVRIANKEETINMSKKKTPSKMKRFEDLKKNSKLWKHRDHILQEDK